jgi:hypothetical protein
MALDELHARRLATLLNLFDDALDRINHLLEGVESERESGLETGAHADELLSLASATARMRERLQAAAARFAVRPTRPPWRQKLAAELSTLWVVLENALPRRMKGYGHEFAPQDRADWESLIRDLLNELERMRQMVSAKGGPF